MKKAADSVLCVGQLVADVVVRPIDALPTPGRTERVEDLQLVAGGCAANTACVLAKLGVKARIAGLVGRDTLGDVVLAEVARCGVDVAVARSAAVATSAVIVLVDGHGERSFFYRPGGNERLAVDAIPPDLLREARFLHVGGAMKLWALDLAALLTRAKTSGCTTSLDTDWDTSGKWFATLQPVLSQVDYLLTNEEEGRALTGLDTPAEIAMRLLATGPRAVVVKRGPRGALAATNGMVQEFPPCDVPVHDTTCAGDAFAAGFLYGLTQQWPVAAAVRFANAAGALATTQISHQGITSLAAVRELLDRSGEDRSGETL